MSRPKYYWYGIVKKMIMRYPQIKEEKSIQTSIFVNAIEKALKETKEMENGDTRIEAISKLLFENKKTVGGVSMEMHYSERKIVGWTSDFIKLCGKNAGF